MVCRVAGRPVDHGVVGDVLPIVNQDGPEIDKQERSDEKKLVHREEHRVYMVRKRLREPIQRVEGVARVRAGHDPSVMRLVETLVDNRMVQTPVDPVDQKIGEHDEEGHLHPVVPASGALGARIVEFGVPAYFEEEHGPRGDGHGRHRGDGLSDLLADLVFEELGVLEGLLIEEEEV